MSHRLLAAALAAATLAGATTIAHPAHADWRYRGGYGYGYGHYGHYGHFGVGPAIVGGALLGLGVGALLTAPYVRPPPVYYAPPPVYYPPPYAYPPPGYYPPY